MNLYIPAAAAEPLSLALWALTRPPGTQGETRYLFAWAEDVNGARWLMVNPRFTIPVHEEAVLDGIADILQPFIDEGLLPDTTNEALSDLITSARGTRLVVYDAFPQFFKDQQKTLQDLIDEGLLEYPSV